MIDFSLYYSETIAIADGKLCYISSRSNKRKGMICRPLEGGENFVTTNLKPLNGVKIGYINTPHGAVLIDRIPSRSPKDGLSIHNTNSTIDFRDYLKEIFNSITDNYPSFEEAKKEANKYNIRVAYNKDWVVDSRGRCINRLGLSDDSKIKKYRR